MQQQIQHLHESWTVKLSAVAACNNDIKTNVLCVLVFVVDCNGAAVGIVCHVIDVKIHTWIYNFGMAFVRRTAFFCSKFQESEHFPSSVEFNQSQIKINFHLCKKKQQQKSNDEWEFNMSRLI